MQTHAPHVRHVRETLLSDNWYTLKKYTFELLRRDGCWQEQSRERIISPLVLLAAFNLDFLCIHPFRDGNGRVSRLLLLLTAYHMGLEVGRYISLERVIEDNKVRYYETLQQSSQSWHEGKHDPWPYIGYLLFILKTAYDEFEERAGQTGSPKGEKSTLVLEWIRSQPGDFRLADIERACPGVGRDWIQTILTDLRAKSELVCSGKGPAARWRRSSPGEGIKEK